MLFGKSPGLLEDKVTKLGRAALYLQTNWTMSVNWVLACSCQILQEEAVVMRQTTAWNCNVVKHYVYLVHLHGYTFTLTHVMCW